ncbi:MAG: hypothetical protein PVG35_14190, partial [Desulfobacterales bacterium]
DIAGFRTVKKLMSQSRLKPETLCQLSVSDDQSSRKDPDLLSSKMICRANRRPKATEPNHPTLNLIDVMVSVRRYEHIFIIMPQAVVH